MTFVLSLGVVPLGRQEGDDEDEREDGSKPKATDEKGKCHLLLLFS